MVLLLMTGMGRVVQGGLSRTQQVVLEVGVGIKTHLSSTLVIARSTERQNTSVMADSHSAILVRL